MVSLACPLSCYILVVALRFAWPAAKCTIPSRPLHFGELMLLERDLIKVRESGRKAGREKEWKDRTNDPDRRCAAGRTVARQGRKGGS